MKKKLSPKRQVLAVVQAWLGRCFGEPAFLFVAQDDYPAAAPLVVAEVPDIDASPELAPLFAFLLFCGSLCFPLTRQRYIYIYIFVAGVLIPAKDVVKTRTYAALQHLGL